jgi:hypothetical protein
MMGRAAAVASMSPLRFPAETSSIMPWVSSSTGPNRPTPATLKRNPTDPLLAISSKARRT